MSWPQSMLSSSKWRYYLFGFIVNVKPFTMDGGIVWNGAWKFIKNEFVDMYKNAQITMPQNDFFIIVRKEEALII